LWSKTDERPEVAERREHDQPVFCTRRYFFAGTSQSANGQPVQYSLGQS
jgi:hypothetical protein